MAASPLKRRRRRVRLTLLLAVVVCFAFAIRRTRSSNQDIRAAVQRAAFRPAGLSTRVTIVTSVNYAFREYLTNLACSITRHTSLAKSRILVLSMDALMHAHATRHGYESIFLGGEASDSEYMFGSKGFNLLSKRKLLAVYKVLKTGVDVLFTDADIVWCADAAAEIARLVHTSLWDDGLGKGRPHLLMQTAWPRSLLNSGLYYARSTSDTLAAFEALLQHDTDSENDQVIVNRVLCRGPHGETVMNGSYAHPSAPHRTMPALCRWDGRVEARLLDAGRFPTGGEIIEDRKIFHHPRRFVMGLCEKQDVAVLHNNCILSSKKRARFVAKGIWFVRGEEECGEAAEATVAARRACGGSKCGPEGDLRRYPDLAV